MEQFPRLGRRAPGGSFVRCAPSDGGAVGMLGNFWTAVGSETARPYAAAARGGTVKRTSPPKETGDSIDLMLWTSQDPNEIRRHEPRFHPTWREIKGTRSAQPSKVIQSHQSLFRGPPCSLSRGTTVLVGASRSISGPRAPLLPHPPQRGGSSEGSCRSVSSPRPCAPPSSFQTLSTGPSVLLEQA